MARRSSNKIQPAVLTFTLETQTLPAATQTGGPGTDITPTVTTLYCDYSQIASLYNRRFYRQGINWATAGMKLLSSPTIPTGSTSVDAFVTVSKIPNTWVASNAWEKAFRAWNKQQMDAIKEAGAESAVAAFRDFKIFADVGHVTAGFAANWLPALYNQGEWQESQIVVPNIIPDASGSNVDPTEYKLHMVGVNNNAGQSRGIIEGYADSRAFPQSPDPVSPVIGSGDNWLRDMFDVGNDTTEITNNATDKNDDLPYDQTNYPGGATNAPFLEIHDQHPVTSSTLGGTTRLKGGNFPCGLVKFQLINYSLFDVDMAMLIDLVPGNHRGYLCEPMTEM